MDTKTCSKCQQEKLVEDFNWKVKSKGIRQSSCKECSRKEGKSHYNKNKSKVISRVRGRNDKYAEENKLWKDQLKCSICEEDFGPCLEFHHIDPNEKDFEISARMGSTPLAGLLKEIEKCVVVCANCHRKIHGGVIEVTEQLVEHSKEITNNALVAQLEE